MCLVKVQPHRNFHQKRYLLVELLIDWQNWFLLSVSELCGFCKEHTDRRNTELHSGKLSFEEVGTIEWLPMFYFACKVLLESMDKNLADLNSDPVTAEDLISSLQKDAKKTVWKDIEAHKKVWSNKNDSEKKIAFMQDQLRGQFAILGTA